MIRRELGFNTILTTSDACGAQSAGAHKRPVAAAMANSEASGLTSPVSEIWGLVTTNRTDIILGSRLGSRQRIKPKADELSSPDHSRSK